MAQPWPSQLQEYWNVDNFRYAFGVTKIETEMDTGPVKARRISTAPIDKITASIDFTFESFAIFKNFYDTTLNGGVDSFEYNHPFTDEVTEFQFTRDEVDITPFNRDGGRWFQAKFQLRVVS